MPDRITKSDLESLCEHINDQYPNAELFISEVPGDSPKYYRLREKEERSGERDIGPAGRSRELWYFMQGIRHANNEWIAD